jgi:hypothetical protein
MQGTLRPAVEHRCHNHLLKCPHFLFEWSLKHAVLSRIALKMVDVSSLR